MSGPVPIDGKDIDIWAVSSPDAEHVLPQLVRRLLWASTKLRRLDMSAGTAMNLSGWDGICEALEDSPHCPRGISGWELSKRADVATKLDEDYGKRSKDPAPLVASRTNYIAVTARRYKQKDSWAAERETAQNWASVRVLDADNLAQWLEECPAVAAWFAGEHLHRPTYELRTLDRFLSDWSRETAELPLPPRLLLLGREQQREQVRRWVGQPRPTELSVQAATRREAQLFVAAALDSLATEPREEIASRTLVVESLRAWRWAVDQSNQRPLVLIPTFSEFERSLGRGSHFAVVPSDRETEVDGNAITIAEPLPWQELRKELESLGIPESKARQLAEQSAGYLRPLQRLLGATEVQKPVWVARERDVELGALVLLGAWEPSHEGDRKQAERLGVDADELDRLCARLTRIADTPIVHEGAGYRWASSSDAWRLLAGTLTKRAFRNFESVAINVLGEDDPKYQLPPNERYYAAVVGKLPSCSRALREGIANSVLQLAQQDDVLLRQFRESLGSRTAESIVHHLLVPTWSRWASLDRQLLLLAEAAPLVFLERLSNSLATDDGAAQLFAEEGDPGLDGAAPHVPLLWALEVVAWAPRSMPLAVEHLMRLAEQDHRRQSGVARIANRPIGSLEGIFHLVTPQTLVEDDERFTVLDGLVRRHPDRGFELLIGLIRQTNGGLLPQSAQPKCDERVPASPRMPTDQQVDMRCDQTFELALACAGEQPERWAQLISQPINQLIGDAAAQRMIDQLLSLRGKFADADCTRISNAARRELYVLYQTSLHEKLSIRKQQLHQILESFEPSDLVLRVGWQFDPGSVLLEPHSIRNHKATEEKLDRQRDTALEEILEREDALDLLARLTERTGDPRKIARALARSARSEEFDALLLRSDPPVGLRPLAAPFALSRHHTLGSDISWLEQLLREWDATERLDDALATLLLRWPEPAVWDLADAIGEPLRTRYWHELEHLGDHDEGQWERAVDRLLAAQNWRVALSTASSRCGQLPTELLVRVLEGFADEPPEIESSRGPDAGYEIQEIFNEIDRRDDSDELDVSMVSKIVGIELRFIRIFDRRSRKPRFVWNVLENSPEFFSTMLMYHYRAEDEDAVDQPDPMRQRLAQNAYTVLEAWRSFPGQTLEDPRARENELHDWATRALELAREIRRGKVAQSEVARVLARPKAGEDGHWPCEAARRLLETGAYPKLARGLMIARSNQRRMTARGAYEGGEQERTLADGYQYSARALSGRWPVTALMLDELSQRYVRRAETEDQEARDDRLRDGQGPERPEPRVEPHRTPETADLAPNDTPVSSIAHLTHLHLHAIGPADTLDLEFASRLSLLSGDNSLGKTFLLDVTWWALTGNWPSSDRIARPTDEQLGHGPTIRLTDASSHVASSSFDRVTATWPRDRTWAPVTCPIVYARVDDGISVWDPLRNAPSNIGSQPEAYHFNEHELWDSLRGPGQVIECRGLLTDWLNWSKDDDSAPFNALLAVLGRLAEPGMNLQPGGPILLRGRGATPVPTIKFPYGDVPLVHLTAGWRRILGLAYMLVWTWFEHSAEARRQGRPPARNLVVLLDEAEAHLHPRWQRVILPALLSAIETLSPDLSVQLVAVTHSPIVTASIEPDFVTALDRVFHLDFIDQRVELQPFIWTKHGDASSG